MKKIQILTILLAALFCAPCMAAENSEIDKYIETAFRDGVIVGDENGLFNSEKIASRAEFAVMAKKFLNLPDGTNVYSDVADDDWFCDAMGAVSSAGLLYGHKDGTARPDESIKCEEVVTALGRYYRAKVEDSPSINGASAYAAEYYAYAAEKGVFPDGKIIEPQKSLTKGELLAIMYGYDLKNSSKIRFAKGYPKVAEKGVFNCISAEFIVDAPCKIYYNIRENGTHSWGVEGFLCDVKNAYESVAVSRLVNINKSYDLYLRIEGPNGEDGESAVLKNMLPFKFPYGDGDKDSPYIIYTKQQLEAVSENPDKAYRLGTDIEIDGTWVPIENFSGDFDGNGYTISGLKVDNKESKIGLFAELNEGKVYSLSVSGEISAKSDCGIIAGVNNGGKIEDCTVWGSVTVKTNNAGGICGQNSGSIKNCLSAVYSVTADSYAGGICGQNTNKIENCLSAAEVVASQMYAGGISGVNNTGEIVGCVAANMSVYNSMTKSSGKISTNKKGAVSRNNFAYDDMISNALYEEQGMFSQSGQDVSWEELIDREFYDRIGWSRKKWQMADDGYRLPCPLSAGSPGLIPGKTAYLPKKICSSEEFAKISEDEGGHYILCNDIIFGAPRKTMCPNGFSGTFDGDGHTVYNLILRNESGLFSNITGGTVKNLNLKNVDVTLGSDGAILTACNYGYIENCTVSGKLKTKRNTNCAAIAGENFGRIKNCTVRVNIEVISENATVGGICANNEGEVLTSSYYGSVAADGDNIIFGGICGTSNGYITECFASIDAEMNSDTSYSGGICGAAMEAGIYKCSSIGSLKAVGKTVYSGGICASAENATIYNCYSLSKIYSTGNTAYGGGICGAASGTYIQNTYSAGTVVASKGDDIFAGGICGYCEASVVMQNISLNPSINSSGKIGAIAGKVLECDVRENYSCEKTLLNSKYAISGGENGITKPLTILKNSEFYFREISNGGLLGWGNAENGDVWTKAENTVKYTFPVLSDTPGQDLVKMPGYK